VQVKTGTKMNHDISCGPNGLIAFRAQLISGTRFYRQIEKQAMKRIHDMGRLSLLALLMATSALAMAAEDVTARAMKLYETTAMKRRESSCARSCHAG